MEVLIVGKAGGTHIGQSLYRAADNLELEAHFCDAGGAYDAPWILRTINWHLLGHRPPYLRSFSKKVVEHCRRTSPDCLLTTGLAPVRDKALRSIGDMGVRRLNFLTDDPWNSSHRASWFFNALPEYDIVFTPRQANKNQLQSVCPNVEYLPFGYDDHLFYREDLTREEQEELHSEVLFVGGADEDRVPFIRSLHDEGLKVATYGGYWDDYPSVSSCSRGFGDPGTIRKATQAADISLCLVRQANRDGHVMRSLEIPASGSAMLVEDTDEHRALFGTDQQRVRYFSTPNSMVQQAKALLQKPKERQLLAERIHEHIVGRGAHTYADRLRQMIEHTAEVECK
ncbi:hypothetical protein GGQ02_003124 [Salinibacter ruber]|uniref:CgeB family protein n=1 Tax=Salinibacter ruber TaxID=146919 RepID=UPI002168E7C0|nr:glycosyltransferase [Salinibacter ruber]MCS4034714.1 hypothetical protein [Salinibacter ruber]